MFMVKDEYANVKNLFKVKIKTTVRSFIWLSIAAAVMFLGALISTVLSILKDNNNAVNDIVTPHIIADFSSFFFFGIVNGYLIIMITYRQINEYLSVLPQTNNSRFIATQLFNYTLAAYTGLIALLMYLLNFGVLKLILSYRDNVYFALNFDAGFIITGFFTFLIYSFLIVAAFGLVGAILRKWKYYAVMAFVVILSLTIANIQWVFKNVPKIFAFIVREPVPIWFILKGTALWLVITMVSLVVNRYTVYYKSQKKTTAAGIAGICVAAAVITMIVPAVILFNTADINNSGAMVQEAQPYFEDDYFSRFTEIRVDVSHLPKGSKLNVEGKNVSFPGIDGEYVYKQNGIYVSGTEELNSLQGDTVVIYYSFLIYKVNGVEVFKYANPKLTAYLEGDTLHIDYTFEKADVIIMPIWGIAGQFECYKEKRVFSESSWMYSSGTSGNGSAHIKVE